MPLVSQGIESFLGGVSQQPLTLRDARSLEEQINGMSRYATGLSKRPPTQHTSVVSAVATTAYNSVHLHTVARSSTDRYRVILSNGDLKVFDALTGIEQAVSFPDGKTYLNTADPGRDIRCVTVGDVTYVLNRTVAVTNGSAKSAAARNEALISIRAADFGTTFGITLDGITAAYTTADGTNPSARSLIGTEQIATELVTLITSLCPGFTAARYGSTIYISRLNGANFTVSASDGLADEGIRAIKKSVQRFEDLPDRAKNGFVVEVTGDPTNQFDNYFVRYDDRGSPNLAGVWRETVKPATLTSLNNSTMPHKLVRGSSLLNGAEASSLPDAPLPGSASGTVTLLDGWERDDRPVTGSSGPIGDPTAYWQLGRLDAGLDGWAASSSLGALDGTQATIRVTYDVATDTLKPGGNVVFVGLWKSNAPSITSLPAASYTLVTEKLYLGRSYPWKSEYLEFTASLPADTRIQVRVRYGTAPQSSGPGPTEAVVMLHPNYVTPGGPPGIQITKQSGASVAFDAAAVYPVGVVVTLTVNAATYTYTTLAGNTGADVAVALAALVGGGFTGTSPSAGVVTVVGTPTPTVTAALSFNISTTFYSADLVLVAGALVGETIKNLSDGSSGVITTNSVNTITVVALSGGATNLFQRGDICSVIGTDTATYVFAEALYKPRLVGDTITVPAPTIVGKYLDEIFYHRNRLGFAAQQTIVMSVAADPLNLFRQSATKLLDSDPIDVQSATHQLANFHSAVTWNDELVLFSSNAQTTLDGQPNLTPATVGLTVKTKFDNTTRMRPVVAGNKLFFARAQGASTRVFEYGVVDQRGTADADDVTEDVPSYIAGTPIGMAVDNAHGFMALLTDADQSHLYVFNYHYNSQTRVQSAWSRWEFGADTRIVSIDIIDGKLGMVVVRGGGVYVETIDLDPAAAPRGPVLSLDRRLIGTATPFAQVGFTVAWRFALPYKIATDGSEGTLLVSRISTGALLDPSYITRADSGSIDISNLGDIGADCIIGVGYNMALTLSTFQKKAINRNGDTEVDTRGRLQIRYVTLKIDDTTGFTARVALDGRITRDYIFSTAAPSRPALHRFPVLGRNTSAIITILDSSPGAFNLTGADWEGDFTTISRRV